MAWQSCSRTDKGVSAIGNVASLKMIDCENVLELINQKLPDDIRILGMQRVTKGFCAKNRCTHRNGFHIISKFYFLNISITWPPGDYLPFRPLYNTIMTKISRKPRNLYLMSVRLVGRELLSYTFERTANEWTKRHLYKQIFIAFLTPALFLYINRFKNIQLLLSYLLFWHHGRLENSWKIPHFKR